MAKNKTIESVSRFIPPLLWVLVIFFFSAQHSPYELILHKPYPAATQQVAQATAALTATKPAGTINNRGVFTFFPKSDDKQEILGRYLHILEYAILAYLLVRALIWNGPINLYLLLTGFFTSTLYALSDEYHQMFVAGRRFETGDILLDALGVGMGILLFILLYYLRFKKQATSY